MFETEIIDIDNYQGNAAINYTLYNIPYTRIVEHKHFEFGKQSKTVITREYPFDCTDELEPYYPINDDINVGLYNKYKELSLDYPNVIFGGRLAEYKYYDMHQVIGSALSAIKNNI
jgi:UDP-galactopyranose mutase